MAFTGGTGDVMPQIMTLSSGALTTASKYVVNQQALPVPRLGSGSSDRATVFELLWVDWYLNIDDVGDLTANNFAYLSTSSLGRKTGDAATLAAFGADVLDPRSTAPVLVSKALTAELIQYFPLRVNLTDMNGNGVLVATDKLFVIGGNTAGTATTGNYIAKIGYRLVNVGTMEYVGIVQSQIS